METWDLDNCTEHFGLCELKNTSAVPHQSFNCSAEALTSGYFKCEIRFWVQRVLVPFLVGLGVLSNFVTIVVLTRRRMRSSTNMYLTALAVSDLLYLLAVFSLSFKHYPDSNDAMYFEYWQYRRFGTWLADATSYTSIWLTVSFTVERYVAVCHPMRGKAFCTESRARIVIIIVYLLCFLLTASTAFEYQTVAYLYRADNATTGTIALALIPTSLGTDRTYKEVFNWFSTITFTFVPLVLLAVFNSFLVHAVHRSQRQRCKMTQVDQSDLAQSQENRITVILIAVVILFFVCQIPHSALTIYYTHFSEEGASVTVSNILLGLGNIFNFLVAINASCNFVLYCALSDKYRRTFMLTFLSCWNRSSPSRMNSLYYNTSVYSNHSRNQSTRSTSVRTPSRSLLNHGAEQASLTRHTSLNVPRHHQVTFT